MNITTQMFSSTVVPEMEHLNNGTDDKQNLAEMICF